MEYKLYHYCLDNFDDTGFGCSYRNIQTILSAYKKYYDESIKVPDIRHILEYFNKKYKQIKNKRELWIEPYHVSQYINKEYDIKSKITLYIIKNNNVSNILKTSIDVYLKDKTYHKFEDLEQLFRNHFCKSKLPIIIDNGIYSYCIGNINKNEVTIIDPHTCKDEDVIKIKDFSFIKNSFWMICIPQNY
jgi:Ufm1-specific protease 2